MKALLHDLHRGLYYRGGAEWTERVDSALDFGDITPALESALNSGRSGLEIHLLIFNEPDMTICLRLDGLFRH